MTRLGVHEACAGVVAGGAPTPALREAAWAVALPEVWHAAVRVALSSFTACFTDGHGTPTVAVALPRGMGMGMGVAGQGGAAEELLQDAVIEAARTHLHTLAQCAALAAAYKLRSGVDIIIAALCRIAAHTLKPIHGNGNGNGAVAAAPLSTSTGEERGPSPVKMPSRGDSPVPPAATAPMSQGEVGAIVPSASPIKRATSAPTGIHGSASVRTLTDLNSSAQDQAKAARRAKAAIAAAFAEDLRGQLALSAALLIAQPSHGSHGSILSATSWQWLLECVIRLARVGLLHLGGPSFASLAKGDLASNGTSGAAASPQPGGGGDGPDLYLGSLISASAFASARYRQLLRVRGTKQAQPPAPAPAPAPAASTHAEDGLEQALLEVVQEAGKVILSNQNDTRTSAATAASAGANADQGPGIGAILFGWLFGSDPAASEAGEATPASSSDEDLEGGHELSELLTEEPDDDEGLTRAGSGGGGSSVGRSGPPASPAFVSGPRDAPTAVSGSVRVVASHACDLLMACAELKPDAFHRALTALVRLTGAGAAIAAADNMAAKAAVSVAMPFDVASSQGPGSPRLARARAAPDAPADPFDDGAAFIATLETARYKCALLPPPPEAPPAAVASRLALAGLATVCAACLPRHSEWISALQQVVETVASQATAATRRVQVATGAASRLAAMLLASGVRSKVNDQVPACDLATCAPPAVALLYAVVTAPAPISGVTRLQAAASILEAQTSIAEGVGAPVEGSLLLALLATPQRRVRHADIAVYLNRASGMSQRACITSEGEVSCFHVLLAVLAACTQPAWLDEISEPAASSVVDGAEASAALVAAALSPRSSSSATASHSALSPPRSPAIGASPTKPLQSPPSLGAFSSAAASLPGDDAHVLELATSRAAHLSLEALGASLLQPADSEASYSVASKLLAAPVAPVCLDTVALYVHLAVPVTTITADDIATKGLDLLALLTPDAAKLNTAALQAVTKTHPAPAPSPRTLPSMPLLDVLTHLAAACTDFRPAVRPRSIHLLLLHS